MSNYKKIGLPREGNSLLRCENTIFRGAMSEPRQCRFQQHHRSSCSPDLVGMKFGEATVLRLGSGKEYSGKRYTTYVVSVRNFESEIFANGLLSGNTTGQRQRHGVSNTAEYKTVRGHHSWITNPKDRVYKNYRHMPFYSEWDPRNGGSLVVGYNWIIQNLGCKPGPQWSLDIVKHELGFVPGNLRWAKRGIQKQNQFYRHLGQVSADMFDIEARKRGYVKL